jgi:transcription-repair coupling factor (superfamily II helicase)
METENLLLKIMLRVLAIKSGVNRVDLKGSQLLLSFSQEHQKDPSGIIDMVLSGRDQYEITPDQVLKVKLKKGNTSFLLSQTKNILKEIIRRVNS